MLCRAGPAGYFRRLVGVGAPRPPGHRLQGFAGAFSGLPRAHASLHGENTRHRPGKCFWCGRGKVCPGRPGSASAPKRQKTPANGLTSRFARGILYKLFSKTAGAFCIKGLFPPAEKREVIRYCTDFPPLSRMGKRLFLCGRKTKPKRGEKIAK